MSKEEQELEEQELREYIEESLEKNIKPIWRDLCQKMSEALVAAYQTGFEEGLLKGFQAGLIVEDTKNQN